MAEASQLVHRVNRVVFNYALLMGGQVFSTIATFILAMYAARRLGVEDYGLYSLALMFSELFFFVADFGLPTILLREASANKNRATEYFGKIVPVQSAFVLMGHIFIIIACFLLGYPERTRGIIFIVGLSAVLGALVRLIRFVFRAFERMEYETLTTILERIFVVGLGISVLMLGGGLDELVMVMLLGTALNIVVLFWLLSSKFSRFRVQFDWQLARRFVTMAAPLALAMFFYAMNYRVGTVVLERAWGDYAVGLYGAAYRIILMLINIPVVFQGVLMPIFSEMFVNPRHENNLRSLYTLSHKAMILLSTPIAVIICVLANDIVLLIYSANFLEAHRILRLLVWSIVFRFGHYVASMALIVTKQMRPFLAGCIIGAGLSLLLNLALAPAYGYWGVSSVSVLSDIAIFVIWYSAASMSFPHGRFLIALSKCLLAGLAMSICILYLVKWSPIVATFSSLIIYLLLLMALRLFSNTELVFLKQCARRWSRGLSTLHV